LNDAHNSVVNLRNTPGTTTLLGSVLIQALVGPEDLPKGSSPNHSRVARVPSDSNLINNNNNNNGNSNNNGINHGFEVRWVLVSVSIGDCKSFLLRNGTALEVSPSQRSSLNVRDPGGRIGTTNEAIPNESWPEVGNMMVNFTVVEPGDILIYVSDGVHDNLNPSLLGINPGDIAEFFSGKTWNDLNVDDGNNLISKWRLEKLSQICKPSTNNDLSKLASDIISYCEQTTQRSRDAMEKNEKDVPKDSGKMDHVSVLVYRVPSLIDTQK